MLPLCLQIIISGSCASCPHCYPRSQVKGSPSHTGCLQEGCPTTRQCELRCPQVKGTLGVRPGLRVPEHRDPEARGWRLYSPAEGGIRTYHTSLHPRTLSLKCDPSLRLTPSSTHQISQPTDIVHKPRCGTLCPQAPMDGPAVVSKDSRCPQAPEPAPGQHCPQRPLLCEVSPC